MFTYFKHRETYKSSSHNPHPSNHHHTTRVPEYRAGETWPCRHRSHLGPKRLCCSSRSIRGGESYWCSSERRVCPSWYVVCCIEIRSGMSWMGWSCHCPGYGYHRQRWCRGWRGRAYTLRRSLVWCVFELCETQERLLLCPIPRLQFMNSSWGKGATDTAERWRERVA